MYPSQYGYSAQQSNQQQFNQQQQMNHNVAPQVQAGYPYNGMQQQSFQQQQDNHQDHQYYPKKQKGLNVYQIPIFTHFNPQTAIVTFYIEGKSGDLSIQLAPAIPGNAAIGLRGPVPKDTKVYDYDKRIYTTFTSLEVIEFVSFLRSKFSKGLDNFSSMIVNTNNMITSIRDQLMKMFGADFMTKIQQSGNVTPEVCQQLYSAFSLLTTKLNELLNQNQTVLNSAGIKNSSDQFGMYRRHSSGDKGWLLSYDSNTNMLHISVTINKNKDSRVHITLSSKAALNLLSILESYISNYAIIQMMANQSSEISKTFANNNILAPQHKESLNYA